MRQSTWNVRLYMIGGWESLVMKITKSYLDIVGLQKAVLPHEDSDETGNYYFTIEKRIRTKTWK